MKERIKEFGYTLEDLLKRIVGEITPDKRLVFVLSILLIGTLANLYMTFRAVQSMSKNDNSKNSLEIRHIGRPEIVERNNALLADSLKGSCDETD
ncbi:MAG TPA: TraL conjugative transposon family protein [Dysgonomonas sp.]|uniref:TraL conjugative transposon family protein n=1 Tax=unclassified Dysgonomonas TaxID=2630389 RepID=UPI0025C6BA51|nr:MULTISPECIES: TraL conjugative transposon family protein [unclassified Dysgonomonas]HML65215.1 TraL conjugative transposon family protein [Dysgonomonas sp.]